jgi:glycosyltransferase A (GT-A) superfamily protein (DUF2064 family)
VSGAIAIFVKTPGYSAVKTRLAATVGSAWADEWYGRAAAAVAAVAVTAGSTAGAAVYWAVAEPTAIAAGAWSSLPNLDQGQGELGARMGRVHTELVRRHGHGLLLGADTPQLAADDLAAALRWCAGVAPRQAIGPARDGGFWLYAANRETASACWEDVIYSHPETARRFRGRFAARGAWFVLPTLTDVDRGDDLIAMRCELAALRSPVPAQRELGAWLAAAAGRGGGREEPS